MKTAARVCFGILVGMVLNGCVTRSLTIRTEPAGAMVYVNDVLKGKSPVSYDFEWYGWHRVMIRKEGYKRVDDRKMMRAPFYLWIPLDLAMELLPLRIRDARTWDYVMVPQEEAIPQPPAIEIPKQEQPASPVNAGLAPPDPETPARAIKDSVGDNTEFSMPEDDGGQP